MAQRSFRPDIEGLRGIAIIAVVLFHCGVPLIGGGFVGVDIFFALSGYLITSLLVAEAESRGRIDFVAFYARRVRRLLPASALVLLVTAAIASIVMAPGELEFAGRAGRAAALYAANVFFAINAADYFAPNVELNPILHMWSLAVEEQFYMLWPLLIAFGVSRSSSKHGLSIWLGLITFVSFAVCVWTTRDQATFAFYQLPARAWEFGVGGLAALYDKRRTASAREAGVLAALGLLATGGSILFLNEAMAFPGWIAAVPILGTCMLLRAGASGAVGLLAWLASRPMQVLGKLSYSWYLWHWPFLVFAATLSPEASVATKCLVAVGALGVAAVSHRYVENWFRYHPKLLKSPALAAAMAVVLTLSTFGAAVAARSTAGRLTRQPELQTLASAAQDIADLPRERCVTLGTSSEVRTCSFGEAPSPPVVLFGDSHAIQWFNPLSDIARDRGFTLTTALKSGCPAVALTPVGVGTPGDGGACEAWRRAAISRIVAMRPRAVILGSSTNLQRPITQDYLAQVERGTRDTLTAFRREGIQVIVIRDTPRLSVDGPSCLARAARNQWYSASACAADAERALQPRVFEAERSAARQLDGVNFLDVTQAICSAGRCEAATPAGPVFRDDNHLTGAYARYLRPLVEQQLRMFIG